MTYGTVLTALSDPTRRNVFESLRHAPRTVAEIASNQNVSRPAISQHLKVLHQAGLVSVRPVGTRRYYALRREGLADLRTYIDGFWTDILSAYAVEVEKQVGEGIATTDQEDH